MAAGKKNAGKDTDGKGAAGGEAAAVPVSGNDRAEMAEDRVQVVE